MSGPIRKTKNDSDLSTPNSNALAVRRMSLSAIHVFADLPWHAGYLDHGASGLTLVASKATPDSAYRHTRPQQPLYGTSVDLALVPAGAPSDDGVMGIGGQQSVVWRVKRLLRVRHEKSLAPSRASSASKIVMNCMASSSIDVPPLYGTAHVLLSAG
jgi:hypothetical protein